MTPHLSGRRWQQNRFNWKDAAGTEGTWQDSRVILCFSPESPSASKRIQEKGGIKCTDPVKSEPWNLLEHLTGGCWRVSRAKKSEQLGSGLTNVYMIRAVLLWYTVLPALLASPCCFLQPDVEGSWGCWFAAQGEEGEGQPTAVPVLDTIPTVLCNLQPCQLLSRQNDTVPVTAEQYDLHENVWLGMCV